LKYLLEVSELQILRKSRSEDHSVSLKEDYLESEYVDEVKAKMNEPTQ
jgi:hypothetical protein